MVRLPLCSFESMSTTEETIDWQRVPVGVSKSFVRKIYHLSELSPVVVTLTRALLSVGSTTRLRESLGTPFTVENLQEPGLPYKVPSSFRPNTIYLYSVPEDRPVRVSTRLAPCFS